MTNTMTNTMTNAITNIFREVPVFKAPPLLMESATEFPLSPEFRSLSRGIRLTRKPRPVSFNPSHHPYFLSPILPITHPTSHFRIKLELRTTLRLTRPINRGAYEKISGRAEDCQTSDDRKFGLGQTAPGRLIGGQWIGALLMKTGATPPHRLRLWWFLQNSSQIICCFLLYGFCQT